jgi:hypothetical protein
MRAAATTGGSGMHEPIVARTVAAARAAAGRMALPWDLEWMLRKSRSPFDAGDLS